MKSSESRKASERTIATATTTSSLSSSTTSSSHMSSRKKKSNNTTNNDTGGDRRTTRTATKKKNSTTIDDTNTFDNNDNSEPMFVVESQNVPYSNHRSTSSILWTVLDSMNPRNCLQPTTIITTTAAEAAPTPSSLSSSNTASTSTKSRSVVVLTAATDTLLACHLPGISEPPPIDDIVEPLIEKIRIPKYRSNALHKLYRLTDRNRKYNRIPIVCTTKYDIIGVIAKYCLVVDSDITSRGGGVNPDRRQALLLINNLCIPVENKATILFGPCNEVLISSILRIIHKRLPEAYIGLVTFLNLAVLNDEAKRRLLLYVPSIRPDVVDVLNNNLSTIKEAPSTYEFSKSPINPKNSLVHIIEQCIQDYIPYIDIDPIRIMGCSTKPSVEQEFIRWSMNLFRTIVSNVPENASIIVNETIIAQVAGYCLYTSIQKQLRQQQLEHEQQDRLKSPKNGRSGGMLFNGIITGNTSQDNDTSNEDEDDDEEPTISVLSWTKDSVEDASLMLLIHCAQYDDCIESIRDIKDLQWTLQQLQQRIIEDGIHKTRAIALHQRLFS